MPVVKNSGQRIPGIDILRGLCIIGVVVHHINLRFRFQHAPWGHMLPDPVINVLFWSGYYGVRVFFVISGFLIAGWSLKRWGSLRNLNIRQFYSMRFARIIPCLVAVLLVFSILHLAGAPRFVINRPHQSLPRALFAALTFHINWLEGKTGYLPGGWDPLWSLSVEEVFYLFFPLLARWLKTGVFVTLLLGFVVVGPVARTLITSDPWVDYSYFSCMDGIALGCLAAMVNAKVSFSAIATRVLLISGASLCVFIEVFRSLQAHLGLYKIGLDVAVLNLGTALLVIALQQRFEKNPSSGHRSTGWLRWFGRNSYEVYLTHMLVVWPMVGIYFRVNQSPNMAAFWYVPITALTGLLGYLLARFYSEPLNSALRRKLLPARASTAATAIK